jgi:hypothetical protein
VKFLDLFTSPNNSKLNNNNIGKAQGETMMGGIGKKDNFYPKRKDLQKDHNN